MIRPPPPDSRPLSRARFANLTANMVDFGARLRAEGLLVTPSEVMDGLRALSSIDLTDRREFYLSLRTVMTSRMEDFPVFDQIFFSYWPAILDEQPWDEGSDQMTLPSSDKSSEDGGEDGDQTSRRIDVRAVDDAEEAEGEEEVAGYSAVERLATKDFSLFQADELEEMIRVTLRLARKMATRLSRRMQAARRSSVIDRRRTMRLNLKYGGDVLELARKERKVKKTKLVVLCDVSGSMDVYSRFLL
ncbi:MAG: VWA domain-containing protein, partial [Chloroflexota bacterium]|nr:VWA domain-containing protein [Chloroflexota bacterium]